MHVCVCLTVCVRVFVSFCQWLTTDVALSVDDRSEQKLAAAKHCKRRPMSSPASLSHQNIGCHNDKIHVINMNNNDLIDYIQYCNNMDENLEKNIKV